MKRPLAYFGFGYLIIQLCANLLSPMVYYPMAAVFAILSFILLLFRNKIKIIKSILFITMIFTVSFLFRGLYYSMYINPIQKLYNTSAQVEGTVCEAKPLYKSFSRIIVKVNTINNVKISNLKLSYDDITNVKLGDKLRFNAKLLKLENDEYNLQNYSKGIYINAEMVDNPKIIGEDNSIIYVFAKIQSNLSTIITNVIPGDEGAVAAAMSVGDKSELSAAIKSRFRCAGISHLLVVSGMHLTIVSGAAFWIFSKIFSRGKIGACFGAIFTIMFMLLAGITPSVIRAGITMLILYLGILIDNTPDTLTSIGLSALILCIQNPFAAADLGLLLSFTATLGVLLSSFVMRNIDEKSIIKKNLVLKKIAAMISVPLFSTLATLPILAMFGSAISLYSIPFNILTVPILPFIAITAFAVGILGQVPILIGLVEILGYVCGKLVWYIDSMAKISQKLPLNQIYINRISSVCAIILLYLLIYIGFKYKIKFTLLYGTCFLSVCFMLQYVYTKDLIYVNAFKLAGQSAIVLTQNNKSACVMYGSFKSSNFVKEYLQEYNIYKITDFIDIRQSKHSATFLNVLPTENYYNIEETVLIRKTIPVLKNTLININRQKNGITACIDINGYKISLDSGTVNHSPYEAVDVYITGRYKPENLQTEKYWCPREIPKWLDKSTNNVISSQTTKLLIIRPVKSFKEMKIYNAYQ